MGRKIGLDFIVFKYRTFFGVSGIFIPIFRKCATSHGKEKHHDKDIDR